MKVTSPKVLLDLRMVNGPLHGIARYALELANLLPGLAPDLSFAGLVGPRGLPAGLGALSPKIPLEGCGADFLSLLEQPALAAALLRSRAHVFHATSFSVPAVWPGSLVVTLHDANHLALPQHYGRAQQLYYRALTGPAARRASALVTISDFSRDELARHLRLSPYRLRVISQGVSECFRPAPPAALERFRERYRLPRRYLLCVGNTKPHKNLALVSSVAALLPLPLVLLAGRGAARAYGFPATTLDLGTLPEDDLPSLYAAASALIFPSRYEGFGLPAVEAMACGCPVVAARAGALPEVIGQAGELFDPDDGRDLVDRVSHLVNDESLRRDLIERGLERAQHYLWRACAERTLAVYRVALERQGRRQG